MNITLVVVRPFGQHAIGDHIVVAADIAAALASEHAHSVVAIATPVSTTEK